MRPEVKRLREALNQQAPRRRAATEMHGLPSAILRHETDGEPLCAACKSVVGLTGAQAVTRRSSILRQQYPEVYAEMRQQVLDEAPEEPQPCGSAFGAAKHVRAGEQVCRPCQTALAGNASRRLRNQLDRVTTRSPRPPAPATRSDDEPWQTDALCRDIDKELGEVDVMFPKTRERGRIIIANLCDRCPVKAECAQAARRKGAPERYGIWGGVHLDGMTTGVATRRLGL